MIKVNLLPAEILAEMKIRERKAKALKSAGAVALVLLAVFSLLFAQRLQAKGQVSAKMRERIAVETELVAYEPYQQLQERIHLRSELLKRAMGSPLAWRRLLAALGSHIPPNVWLTNLTLAQGGEMVMQGLTFDHPAVANWLGRLAEIPGANNVRLVFAAEEIGETDTLVRFEVRAVLTPGQEYAPLQEEGV